MSRSTNADLILAAGFESAFLGVAIRPDGPNIAVYSMTEAVRILTERGGLDREEARRVLHERVRDIDLGDSTPLWVEEMTVDELRILASESETVH